MDEYKYLLTPILGFFLVISKCYSQQIHFDKNIHLYNIPAIPEKNETTENITDSLFMRVLDGFSLTKHERINHKIKHIRRLNDPEKLRRMGVRNLKVGYLFYSSYTTQFHESIYDKTDLPTEIKDANVPLIVNNTLITPDKYHLVKRLRANRVKKVEFIRPSKALVDKYPNIVLGVINVSLRGKLRY